MESRESKTVTRDRIDFDFAPRNDAIQRDNSALVRFSGGARFAQGLRSMHGVLARFPFRAELAHRFAQTNGERGDGFEALGSALRQTAVAFPPYFDEQQFSVAKNSRKRIVQFVAQNLAEVLAFHVSSGKSRRRVDRLVIRARVLRSRQRLSIALRFAQAPLDEAERDGQATARAYDVIRGSGSHQAGEFCLMLRVSDYHHRRKRGQR